MLVLFTLPLSSSLFVSLLARRIIRETMCALPQSLLLWFLLQCAQLVYKVQCFMVRFLDPRNRFSKKQRDKLHDRFFKERFICHIWSYALQTIGCKDSLKSKSLMNVTITWQTFKDNATANAPLFLKWFQLRSKWSILSFAANEKEQTPMRNLQFSVKESHSFIGLKTKQNLFFTRQLTKWFLCVLTFFTNKTWNSMKFSANQTRMEMISLKG